jgi:hypothetical protein
VQRVRVARCAQRTRQPHTACVRSKAPPPASAREHTVGRQRSPSPAAQTCARGRASSAALRRATHRCWKGFRQSVISFDSSAPPPHCASARDDECLFAKASGANLRSRTCRPGSRGRKTSRKRSRRTRTQPKAKNQSGKHVSRLNRAAPAPARTGHEREGGGRARCRRGGARTTRLRWR